jgi:hypothetical protein
VHHHDNAGLGQVFDEAGAPLAEPELVAPLLRVVDDTGFRLTAITSRIDWSVYSCPARLRLPGRIPVGRQSLVERVEPRSASRRGRSRRRWRSQRCDAGLWSAGPRRSPSAATSGPGPAPVWARPRQRRSGAWGGVADSPWPAGPRPRPRSPLVGRSARCPRPRWRSVPPCPHAGSRSQGRPGPLPVSPSRVGLRTPRSRAAGRATVVEDDRRLARHAWNRSICSSGAVVHGRWPLPSICPAADSVAPGRESCRHTHRAIHRAGPVQRVRNHPKRATPNHPVRRILGVCWPRRRWAAGLRKVAIAMARSSGNPFVTNFYTYDAPWPTKVRLALANSLRKVRTRSWCCGNYGQPGC